MNDRKIGYAVLLFAGIILLSFCVYVYVAFFHGHSRIEVVFPHLGILAVDDAVKIRGKQVGHVLAIERRNNTAVVRIELYQPVTLKSDYRIREHDRGLMGDREIEIIPGTLGREADLRKPLSGVFVPGIAESIPLAAGLKTQIDTLLALIHRMSDTTNPKSFVREFNDVVGRIDTATGQLSAMVSSIQEPVDHGVAQLEKISGQTRTMSKTMVTQADRVLPRLDSLLSATELVLARISPAIDSVSRYTQGALGDSTNVARMLRPVSFLDTINVMIRSINHELAAIRKTGRLNLNMF